MAFNVLYSILTATPLIVAIPLHSPAIALPCAVLYLVYSQAVFYNQQVIRPNAVLQKGPYYEANPAQDQSSIVKKGYLVAVGKTIRIPIFA